MSGGSYNYACNASDLEDALDKAFDLHRLAERMYEKPGDIEMEDVAADLDSLLAYITEVDRRVTARLRRLADTMHAIEWLDSGDSGPDGISKAVAAYRGET